MAKRSLIAVIVLGVLACAMPASGSAAVIRTGGVAYVTKGYVAKPGNLKPVRAMCPKRTNVISGGFYNSGGFGDAIGIHSFPVDGKDRRKRPDDGWAAQIRAIGEPVSAETYAVCVRTAPEYVRRTVTVPPGDQQTSFTLECDPSSLVSVAGGSQGAASVRELGGVPFNPDTWTQRLINTGPAEREVTVFAVCSKIVRVLVQQIAQIGPETQTFATASCPAEAPTVIGGSVLTGSGELALAATQPLLPDDPPGAWRVWLDNYASAPGSFSALAFCKPAG